MQPRPSAETWRLLRPRERIFTLRLLSTTGGQRTNATGRQGRCTRVQAHCLGADAWRLFVGEVSPAGARLVRDLRVFRDLPRREPWGGVRLRPEGTVESSQGVFFRVLPSAAGARQGGELWPR